MADSAPAPMKGTKGRPSTSKDGGGIPPGRGAQTRVTSTNFEDPGIKARVAPKQMGTRETPVANTMKKVR